MSATAVGTAEIPRPRPCESCQKPVIDLRHERTGKLAPIDAQPVPHGGNVTVNIEAGTYHIVSKKERAEWMLVGTPVQLYLSHLFTCKDADAWFRRRR